MPPEADHTAAQSRLSKQAVRVLARSLFREMTAQGYSVRQIVALATELIGEVTSTMASQSEPG